ncbi:TetR/AcrR family transcriptional regulator [Xanthobacter autotrophicus]|uniref:TetR/AcrR family transcriptional regulator n=1 Tax=Xanthobacter autotrophicus TaxID=280 RepID=UPI00372AADB1
MTNAKPDSRRKRGRHGGAAQIEETTRFDRRQQIIIEAARLFAAKGFEATSMRDIADATGILAGSLYHHFTSKEELFVAVHTMGMDILARTVAAAIEPIHDPWDRLSAAVAAHCTAVLEAGDFMIMVVPKFPASIGAYHDELVRQRDQYEAMLTGLTTTLKLPDGVDPRIFRLHLLGALNWTQTWYRPGGSMTPAEIGRQLVLMLRRDDVPTAGSRPRKRSPAPAAGT